MNPISRPTVVILGVSQLVCWGISFYLIGVFGDLIVDDLRWSRPVVYGGFSAALLVMGVTSPMVGRLIDRLGGGRVMAGGSALLAVGFIVLATARSVPVYYVAWVILGLGMRPTLYDAAFATLARLGGPGAKRPMAQITLLGGLASTVFWPVGHALAESFGWRGAVFAYAVIAALTIPLHLAIPATRHQDAAPANRNPSAGPETSPRQTRFVAAALYAIIVTLINGLNAGMSAHMIGVLTEMGVAAALAVTISSLRGIGQSLARLVEVVFGGKLHPVDLNLLAALALPTCFVAGLWSGAHVAAAITFAFVYGAGNGILSITRGTLPLVLFDVHTYGAFVGKLLVPSFLVSAIAPLAFAAAIERFGGVGALYLSTAIAAVILAASIGLKLLPGRRDGA